MGVCLYAQFVSSVVYMSENRMQVSTYMLLGRVG